MIDYGKQNLLGVGISAIDYERALETVMTCATQRQACAVTALAVHGVITGALDRHHRHRLNSFELVTPDGQPVRWALRLLYGIRLRDRVYGPKLTLQVCQQAARERVPVFFYGNRELVLEELRRRLKELCPGLEIAGMQPSAFRKLTVEERDRAVQMIRDSGARILLVGLGCPRQEVFAYEMSRYLKMPILAVGAAFDYHAGVLTEPPEMLQRMGLQWLYRLLQDPKRLWRRYLFTNFQFVALTAAQWLRLWRPAIQKTAPPAIDVLYG